MFVLNMFVVHDINGLDAYTLCNVYGQDSVVAMPLAIQHVM